MTKYPPVMVVEWIDSYNLDPAWREQDDEPLDEVRIRSTGYIIKRSKRMICLASSLAADGQHCNAIHIPRGCIISSRRVG